MLLHNSNTNNRILVTYINVNVNKKKLELSKLVTSKKTQLRVYPKFNLTPM